MDELPELPFELVLSYLNLKDRLKARTISKAWRNKFDRYPVKSLCYSNCPSDFILGKNRWVSGAFAKNFINSTRFASFFDTFGQTILSTLKRLRLCDLHLSEEDSTTLPRTLNSFRQLEQLDIIRAALNQQDVLNLNLPMLASLQLEGVKGIQNLTLEAPRLREVKILDPYGWGLRVEIVHGESVERFLVDWLSFIDVKNLKNLKVSLYIGDNSIEGIYSTSLSSLRQLKEIHTSDPDVSWLFEQKQRLGRADLKIYLCGLLLNGPDDPAINSATGDPYYLAPEWFVCLAKNPSALADEIPFYKDLDYSIIEDVDSDLVVDLLKRCTELKKVTVNLPVQAIQHFLNLLKNFKNIVEVEFRGDHPQDLFDRLPEHCAVQMLSIKPPPSDLDFLFRLKHLIHLDIDWSIESETFRRALEELPALYYFSFIYDRKSVSIEIGHPKQFQVSVDYKEKTTFYNLNAAIEFIVEN